MSKTPKKSIQKMLEKMIQQDEEDRKLVTSSEYLEWLVSYTDKFESVSEHVLELYQKQVLPRDYFHASKLSALYHIIKCYAEKEGIRQEENHILQSSNLGGRYAFTLMLNGKKRYFLIGHTVNVMKFFVMQFEEREFKAFSDVNAIDLNKVIEAYQEEV